MPYKSLQQIVNEVKAARREYDTTNDQQYLQFAIRGVRDLNLFTMPTIKVAYIPLESNNTIILPEDYVDYTRVGYCFRGRILDLGENRNIPLSRGFGDCGELIQKAISDDDSSDGRTNDGTDSLAAVRLYTSHWHDGQYVAGWFGLGGGFNRAYFRVDVEKNRIEFQGSVPDGTIALEYKTNGIDPSGNTVMPDQATEAMIAWVQWQIVENDERKPQSLKERKRQLYIIAEKNLRSYELKFTMAEFLATQRMFNKQTPKR